MGDVASMARTGLSCARKSERLRSAIERAEDVVLSPTSSSSSAQQKSSSSKSSMQVDLSTSSSSNFVPPEPKQLEKMDVVSDELAAALDRCNISNRNAMYIISETVKVFGQKFDFSLDDVNLSVSTIRRKKKGALSKI